jgi:hypothetical protein
MNAIHGPVRVHNAGRWSFGSSLVTLIVVAIQAFDVGDHLTSKNDVALILRIVNIVSAILTLFGSVSIPRRPVVYFRDQDVDAQWTSSMLSRYTWSWTRPIIDLASKKGDLDEKDIPEPDHTIRAEEVVADWKSGGFTGKLMWSLINAYKGRFALQWGVTVARCLLGIGPFWTMLQLINLLQERGGGGSPSRLLWSLVILLGVFSLTEQWMDGWVNYYSITMISQPIRAQLSALIYEKSLKRKNVKSADKPKEAEAPPTIIIEDSEEAPEAVNVDATNDQDVGTANGND